MTEYLPDEPGEEEQLQDDERQPADADEVEDQDADEIEQELLDAMKTLRRTNKKIEEYLDCLARDVEKPSSAPTEPPSE